MNEEILLKVEEDDVGKGGDKRRTEQMTSVKGVTRRVTRMHCIQSERIRIQFIIFEM